MALTHWAGDRVRQSDAVVSNNYLDAYELDELNRLVTMFLDFAEDRALRRLETRMADWIAQTDRFLTFNERSVPAGPSRISHEKMETIVAERYAAFDDRRRTAEALAADHEAADDLRQLHAEASRLAAAANARKP